MPTSRKESNCVRAFLGDGDPTPATLARLMEYFYINDFLPLQDNVKEMGAQIAKVNDTLVEWKTSLRTLMWLCAIVGGLISGLGTVAGIIVALSSIGSVGH